MVLSVLAARQVGAAIDFVPLLFIVYVAYAIIASLVKAARRAQTQAQAQTQTQAPIAPGTPGSQTFTADQLRAAIAKRRAALLAASSAPSPPVVGRPLAAPPTPVASTPVSARAAQTLDAVPGALQLLTSPTDVAASQPAASLDLRSAMAALPPAALAIVASAVIGPCAAHRGAGHQPEDW